jgi:hypothetical protein
VAEFEDAEDLDWMGAGGGGGAGGLGSGRLSERVTAVTPTTGLDLDSMPSQMRPSTAGNCLGSAHALHPANLPLLSIAHEGTGSGGGGGGEGTPPDPPPGLQILGSNSGLTISPLLMGLPTSFLHTFHCKVARVTLVH